MNTQHKQKIGSALKGRHLSPKTEFKKGHVGFASNKGKHLSKEVKEKISQSLKGRKAWNKGKTGLKSPNKGKKFPQRCSEKHFAWKGDGVSYAGLHMWVSRHKVKPGKCSHCGKRGNSYQIHWSNVDHKYSRNLEDYIALCASCHKDYDLKNDLTKH